METDEVTLDDPVEYKQQIWVAWHFVESGSNIKVSARPRVRKGPNLTFAAIITFAKELGPAEDAWRQS